MREPNQNEVEIWFSGYQQAVSDMTEAVERAKSSKRNTSAAVTEFVNRKFTEWVLRAENKGYTVLEDESHKMPKADQIIAACVLSVAMFWMLAAFIGGLS